MFEYLSWFDLQWLVKSIKKRIYGTQELGMH